MNQVAAIKELFLYPVKSMRGIAVQELEIYWYGFSADRKFSFVRSDNPSGFPWLTGREVPDLLLYQPYFADPAHPALSKIRVKSPFGADYALDDSKLAAELAHKYGKPIHLMQLKRGTFDCMPVSVMSLATIQAIGASVGEHFSSQRFRPNIVVDTGDEGPGPEDAWLNQRLIFGDRPDAAQAQINYKTQRCQMINLDPATAERDSRVLRAVGQNRDSCAGIYGAVVKLGTIRVGDPVFLVNDNI